MTLRIKIALIVAGDVVAMAITWLALIYGNDRVVAAAVTAVLIGALGAVWAVYLSARRHLVPHIEAELELLHEVRLVMQDLRSRDPQLDEALSVALLELDKWEKDARTRLSVLNRGGAR